MPVLNNLKLICRRGWYFLTRLKRNRKVNYAYDGNLSIEKQIIPRDGLEVHLKDYEIIRVFHRDDDNNHGNEILYWATDILCMNEYIWKLLTGNANMIEKYHRNLKQYCGVEACQARAEKNLKGHIINMHLCLKNKIKLHGSLLCLV